MSIQDDTHDKLTKAYMAYFKANEQFACPHCGGGVEFGGLKMKRYVPDKSLSEAGLTHKQQRKRMLKKKKPSTLAEREAAARAYNRQAEREHAKDWG